MRCPACREVVAEDHIASDASLREHHAGRPGGGAIRAARLRQPRAVARGDLPGRVRQGRGAAAARHDDRRPATVGSASRRRPSSGGSTASGASSPRRCAIRAGRRSSAAASWARPHRRQPGDRRRVRTRRSRAQELDDLVTPSRRSCRGWPGSPSTSRRWAATSSTSTALLPARRRACGRSSPCRARSRARRSAAAWSSSRRRAARSAPDRAREAVGPLVVMLALAVLVFALDRVRRRIVRGAPGRRDLVTAAFGYAIWLGLLALVAGALAFALAPFLGRGAAAGIAGFVMFAGFILNGYQGADPGARPLREPHLVGLDLRPRRPRGPVRLGLGRPRGDRDRRPPRDRHRSIRPARHRRHDRPPHAVACRGRSRARRAAGRSDRQQSRRVACLGPRAGLLRPALGGVRSGRSWINWGLAAVRSAPVDGLPGHRLSPSSAASSSCCSWSSG